MKKVMCFVLFLVMTVGCTLPKDSNINTSDSLPWGDFQPLKGLIYDFSVYKEEVKKIVKEKTGKDYMDDYTVTRMNHSFSIEFDQNNSLTIDFNSEGTTFNLNLNYRTDKKNRLPKKLNWDVILELFNSLAATPISPEELTEFISTKGSKFRPEGYDPKDKLRVYKEKSDIFCDNYALFYSITRDYDAFFTMEGHLDQKSDMPYCAEKIVSMLEKIDEPKSLLTYYCDENWYFYLTLDTLLQCNLSSKVISNALFEPHNFEFSVELNNRYTDNPVEDIELGVFVDIVNFFKMVQLKDEHLAMDLVERLIDGKNSECEYVLDPRYVANRHYYCIPEIKGSLSYIEYLVDHERSLYFSDDNYCDSCVDNPDCKC